MKRVHKNFQTQCGKATSIKRKCKKSRFILNRIVLHLPLSSYLYVGAPEDHPRVGWLSRRTQKTCYSHSTVYYSKRKQIKIGQGERYLRQCLGETSTSFNFPLTAELYGQPFILPARMDDRDGVLPTREAHWDPMCRDPLGSCSCRHGGTPRLTWLLSLPLPGVTLLCWPAPQVRETDRRSPIMLPA